MQKQSGIESFQKRINDLERQLAEAQATILALQEGNGKDSAAVSRKPESESALTGEKGFRQALLAAPYPLLIWAEDGRILLVNESFTELSGYSREDIPTFEDWLRQAFDPQTVQMPAVIFFEETPGQDVKKTREFEITTRSGEKRVWDISTAALGTDGENRRLMITMAADVTERRQIEEQLEENEQRFSIIFHKAPFAAALSRFQDGTFVDVNDEFERVFGYKKRELLGRTSLEVGIHPEAERRQQILAQIQSQGSARSLEVRLQTRSGESRDFLLNIDLVSISGQKYILQTAQDVTERNQADEIVKEMARLLELDRARLSTILEHLPIGVWISDQEGKLVGKNEQADRIWAGEAPLLNRIEEFPQYQAWYPGSTELLKPEEYPLAMALRTGQPVAPVELDIRRFDGSQGTVLVSAVPIRDHQNAMTGVVAVNMDITDRKQAERERREAEERYTTLFHSIQEGFAHYRAVYNESGELIDLKVIEINKAGARISGVPRESQLGKTWRQVWPQLEDHLFQVYQRVDETGESLRFDDHNKITGRIYDVTISRLAPGELIVSFNDITERKQVEKALQESEQRYRGLFERMQEGLVAAEILLDQSGKPVDYRYLDVNPATERQFNLSREQFIGRTFTEVMPEGSREWIETLGSVALTGQSASVEQYFAASKRWFEAHAYSPRPGQFVNILTDITERKTAEQALRESEERFRSLADSMPQLVWTALPDGRVDYYNQRYKEYQAIKQVNSEDWEWTPVLHPADMQATVDAWLHSLETGGIYQIEHRVRMNDGSYRWHLSRGVPMRGEKGRIIRWFGTATDIHDLKLAEEQLKLYASRLEKSNHELEQFAFMASHDLQEPLRKIEMFGDLLLERSDSLQERERSYLDRMRDAASRMRDMIEGLLQLSRVATQGKPFVQVSLSQVTATVLADQEDRVQRRKAHIEVGPLPVISGDPLQLRQLMQNLIGNALKYHQPGKTPEIKIFAIELADKIKVCIEDKGIGFDQEDADRIFEPFQRLVGRSQYEGSGIGLAICRRIVERHGGDIAAVSEPGIGTTFVMSFPIPAHRNTDSEAHKKGS